MERRHRAGELRRRSVAIAFVVFAVFWVAVFTQMASGHDPMLGTGSEVAAVTSQASERSGSRAGGIEGSSSATTTAAQPAQAPAPIVTSQS